MMAGGALFMAASIWFAVVLERLARLLFGRHSRPVTGAWHWGTTTNRPGRSEGMRTILGLFMILLLGATAVAQQSVSFPTSDGGLIHADEYGNGSRGLVLAHGARFNKASWARQAPVFAAAGYRVLAIDFRGYGQSRGPLNGKAAADPLAQDVLAAVRYLKETGASTVSVIGVSVGPTRRRPIHGDTITWPPVRARANTASC